MTDNFNAAVWIAGFRGKALLREAVQVTSLRRADPRCVLVSVFFVGSRQR